MLRPFLFWRSMPFGRIALRRILKFQCLFFVLFLIPTLAQRRPVLPQIDEPHPYYFRELYLPQLTMWPEQPELGAGLEELIYSMGGLAVEAENSIPKLPLRLRTELATTTSRIGRRTGKVSSMFPTRKMRWNSGC